MYSWIRKALTRTMSPMVMLPSTTPPAARHIMAVTPRAMMICWPRFSHDSETWLRVARVSHWLHLLVIALVPRSPRC